MRKAQVILRHAKSKDIQGIINLQAQLDRPLPKTIPETKEFEKIVEGYIHCKGKRGIILATHGRIIIGLVSFALLDRLNQSLKEFWIPELVVSEEYRGRGIGKLLIQKCESIAKKEKCYRIRLESRNDRIDSHVFYRRIGFQQIALVFERRM
jgi:GNAT superfamily N-acetyltransferase